MRSPPLPPSQLVYKKNTATGNGFEKVIGLEIDKKLIKSSCMILKKLTSFQHT